MYIGRPRDGGLSVLHLKERLFLAQPAPGTVAMSISHQELAMYKLHNRDLLVCFGLTVLKIYSDCLLFAYSKGIGLKPLFRRSEAILSS